MVRGTGRCRRERERTGGERDIERNEQETEKERDKERNFGLKIVYIGERCLFLP